MVTYVSIISRSAFEHDDDSGTIYSFEKICFLCLKIVYSTFRLMYGCARINIVVGRSSNYN